jgi:hypothetical protein
MGSAKCGIVVRQSVRQRGGIGNWGQPYHSEVPRVAEKGDLVKIMGRTAMSIYQHSPAAPLGAFVERFWYYVDYQPDHDRQHCLETQNLKHS